MTLRQCRLIMNASRSIRIDRLVNGTVELEQVLEDFRCSEVLGAVRPLIIVNDFLALVYERSAHIEEPFPCQIVLPIVDRAGHVLNARHLEQLVRMRWDSRAGKALFVYSDWTGVN